MFLSGILLQPDQKYANICRGNAGNASRLTDGSRFYGAEFLLCFSTKTLNFIVIQVFGEFSLFQAFEFFYLQELSLYIAIVFDLNGSLFACCGQDLRPCRIKFADGFIGMFRALQQICQQAVAAGGFGSLKTLDLVFDLLLFIKEVFDRKPSFRFPIITPRKKKVNRFRF